VMPLALVIRSGCADNRESCGALPEPSALTDLNAVGRG
jgi:hypothetical protein